MNYSLVFDPIDSDYTVYESSPHGFCSLELNWHRSSDYAMSLFLRYGINYHSLPITNHELLDRIQVIETFNAQSHPEYFL